jgi:hypothetical protein
MVRIRQQLPRERVENPARELLSRLAAAGVSIRPGARVAIGVGSRGIASLVELVRATVQWVAGQGGRPFIVPAMGSHGGATAEGQRAVLDGYGVTEAAVGAPIRSSLEVVELPAGDLGVKVYCDRLAAEADATVLINRVKPHTSFHGAYESGLMKMAAIGLGKHAQAAALHRLGCAGLRDLMPRVARQVLRHGNIVLGIAVVENAAQEVQVVRAIPAARIPEEEPALLDLARRSMPSLPADSLDLLIVDEMGKNISGLGMDTHIIGRLRIPGQPDPERPDIRLIFVRSLTTESRGNAAGIGLADIVSRRLFDEADLPATYANVLTTGFIERARIPLIAETDRQALEMARLALGRDDMGGARVIRIRNTLRLDEVLASETLVSEIRRRSGVEIAGPPRPLLESGDALASF